MEQDRERVSQFYAFYHKTRLLMIEEFKHAQESISQQSQQSQKLPKSPKFQQSLEKIVHAAQIVLHRVVFCCYAEAKSRALLPEHILEKTLFDPIRTRELHEGESWIWQNLLHLFQDIAEGNVKKHIHRYNGNIFQEKFHHISIPDMHPNHAHLVPPSTPSRVRLSRKLLLKSTSSLFRSDITDKLAQLPAVLHPVYVNLFILCHMDFENTITESMLGEIFELSLHDLHTILHPSKAKRSTKKRNGVYYTPRFVTEYLIRTALLQYLRQDPTITTFAGLLHENRHQLDHLKERLFQLRILDPACGSGAFLVKCVDILAEFHIQLDTLRLTSHPAPPQTEKEIRMLKQSIVLQNIYGVDLSPESVEMTKLALYLKIATPGTEYSLLDSHIKVGNSLIADPNYSKAFKWDTEFLEIMKDGGFHLLIGNPPWGADMSDYRSLLTDFASIDTGQSDIYWFFLYHGIQQLLQPEGIVAYAIPNEVCLCQDGVALRRFLLQYSIRTIVNLGYDIFEAVNRPSALFILQKTPSSPDHPTFVEIMVNLKKGQKKQLRANHIQLEDLKSTNQYVRDQRDFQRNPEFTFNIWTSPIDIQIITQIDTYIANHPNRFRKMSQLFTNGRGIDTNKKGTHYECPKCGTLNQPFGVGNAARIETKPCVNPACDYCLDKQHKSTYRKIHLILDQNYTEASATEYVPGFIGEDLAKFRFTRPPRCVRYFGNTLKSFPEYRFVKWKKPAQFLKEKIVIRKIADTPNLMVIEDGLTVFNDQLLFFQRRSEYEAISTYFYLAVLGSRIYHYILLKKYTDPDKELFPYLKQQTVKKMYVPFVSQAWMEDKNSPYHRITRSIKHLLGMIQEYHAIVASKDESETQKAEIYQTIETEFNRMDRLIMEIYGITCREHQSSISKIVAQFGFKIF